MNMTAEGAGVGIFRLQLFKASEIFIRAQAEAMRRYRPVFIGRRLFSEPSGVDVAVPGGGARASSLVRNGQIVLLRRPQPFVEALRQSHPKLIHAHFAIDGVFALPLAQRLGVPLITTLHGFDVTRSSWDMLTSGRPSLINGVIWRKRLFKGCRRFICVSEFIKRAAIARGFPEERLQVHYIGTNCAAKPLAFEERDGNLLIHVGRLVEKKGTSHLLKALAIVKPRHHKVRLVIIGDGPLRAALEAESAQLGLSDTVSFLGVQPHSEVLRWVSRSAMQVVPSITAADGDMEGFGMVNIEAGALGVPVVAFDSGGIREAVKHLHSGLLAQERDVSALANNILSLLTNDDLRRRIGERAREHVEDNFNIARQSQRLESIYDDLLLNA